MCNQHLRKEDDMLGLTESVSRSLEISEEEADKIIDEQAQLGLDMMSNEGLDIEDVEDLMADMGIEPDLMEEFLMRMC